MVIIRRSSIEETVNHSRAFQRIGDTEGSGYSFPCDAQGAPLSDKYRTSEERAAQIAELMTNPAYKDRGVIHVRHSWRLPAVGKCDACNRKVTLSGFTNTCECGSEYNSAGQRLAPREQWGEETGETASDILIGSEREDW